MLRRLSVIKRVTRTIQVEEEIICCDLCQKEIVVEKSNYSLDMRLGECSVKNYIVCLDCGIVLKDMLSENIKLDDSLKIKEIISKYNHTK